MRKVFIQLLISIFAFCSIPAHADDDHSSSSSGGGGSGVGIAIGAAAVIGLLIWALSDKKDAAEQNPEAKDPMTGQTPIAIESETKKAIQKTAPTPSGGVGNVKSMEF